MKSLGVALLLSAFLTGNLNASPGSCLLTGYEAKALDVALSRFSASRFARDLALYKVSVGRTKSGYLVTFVPPPAKMTTKQGPNGFDTVKITSTSARFIHYWISSNDWRVVKEEVDKD